MKPLRIALFVGAVLLPLLTSAGCAEAATEKVIYAFCTGSCDAGNTDGVLPEATLNAWKDKLYGTTYGGGGTGSYCGVAGGEGCGTVFSLDPNTGTETILHAFGGQPNDGANPRAGLIVVNDRFYGTTGWGGRGPCTYGCGSVFSIDPATGRERVLHSFNRFKGELPGGVINVKGTLYGTTAFGGRDGRRCPEGCGTVFSFDLSTRKYGLLHNFHYDITGSGDMAKLLNVSGQLYGTTAYGGTYGYGTVFSVSPTTGDINALYDFEGYDEPSGLANLIDVNGTLYGTTTGSDALGEPPCCGAVFSLDPKTDTVQYLHSFCGQSCSDGANPIAGLVNVGGVLYGTTSYGGTGTCSNAGGTGCGTVFSIDLSTDNYSVVHSFQNNGTDGIEPWASLVDVKGTLYGTTLAGGGGTGCGSYGCGTVFSITP